MKLFRTLLRFISTGGTSLLTQPNVITQPSYIWFEKWAHSPQAAKFTNTDWKRLYVLAPLVDEYHSPNTDAARKGHLLTEIRLGESKIGFTKFDYLSIRVKDTLQDHPREARVLLGEAVRAALKNHVTDFGKRPVATVQDGVLTYSKGQIEELADAIHAALLRKQQYGSLGFK